MQIPLAPLAANLRQIRLLATHIEREIVESQARGLDDWNESPISPSLVVARRKMSELNSTVHVVMARIGKADR